MPDGAGPGGAAAGASPGPLFVPQKNKPASSGPVFSFSTTSFLCKCCVFHEIAMRCFQTRSSELFRTSKPTLGTSRCLK